MTPTRADAIRTAWLLAILVLSPMASTRAGDGPFAGFDLPDAWEERFWAEPGVIRLLDLEPEDLVDLVPSQAGLRFCRCPGCGAVEAEEPLAWSIEEPGTLTCRRCGIVVPNETYPAKATDGPFKDKVPEETIEVRDGITHVYPYHLVADDRRAYPDERLYLAAKRDYEAREFLARAALYAAVRHRERPDDPRDADRARLACVLLLRFAQVYPNYATHFDRPGQPKYFERADLGPPYRRGFRSGRWDWSGCLDVPINLAVAFALLRDDPAWTTAGEAMGDPEPTRTVERSLFRASAGFSLAQLASLDDREAGTEDALLACRGVLAVGRLLDDPDLTGAALGGLDRFFRSGFYHDGLWRPGDPASQRRVVALLDDWFDRLLAGVEATPSPMLGLIRSARGVALVDAIEPAVRLAAWPSPNNLEPPNRRPALLGGAGLTRLAVGQGGDALDLELRGLGDLGASRSDRLAIRLAVGGRTVLADLDDLPPTPDGWDLATASHNLAVVDGLNQRESPLAARQPAPGSDILFFAADPDFQIATFEDRYAYPKSAGRYRRTVIVSSGARGRYAVDVFEIRGGLQHDLLVHGPIEGPARWNPSNESTPGPATLLPPSIPFLPDVRASDGRWFVQAFGAFEDLRRSRVDRPAMVALTGADGPSVRLHLLGDKPATLIVGSTPAARTEGGSDRRAGLVLRRRSADGSGLDSTFVTLIEPVGAAPPLGRVGRVASDPGTIVLYVETADGPEHLILNLAPGTSRTVALIDGQALKTDGVAVRLSAGGLVLAGGTSAEAAGRRVGLEPAAGTLTIAARQLSSRARGWFEADGPVDQPGALAGRTLIIRHGDGSRRGWTLARVENTPEGRARLHVREEPGFRIEPETGAAHYDQLPGTIVPGPHTFRVSGIARTR